jgi:hypothetical protein
MLHSFTIVGIWLSRCVTEYVEQSSHGMSSSRKHLLAKMDRVGFSTRELQHANRVRQCATTRFLSRDGAKTRSVVNVMANRIVQAAVSQWRRTESNGEMFRKKARRNMQTGGNFASFYPL